MKVCVLQAMKLPASTGAWSDNVAILSHLVPKALARSGVVTFRYYLLLSGGDRFVVLSSRHVLLFDYRSRPRFLTVSDNSSMRLW